MIKKFFESIGKIFSFADKMNFSSNWVEVVMVILLIVGFLTSLLTQNALTSYLIIFLIGMICGREVYKKENAFRSYLILIGGLLAGYLLGIKSGSILLNIVFFVLGNFFSYTLHKKRIIE